MSLKARPTGSQLDALTGYPPEALRPQGLLPLGVRHSVSNPPPNMDAMPQKKNRPRDKQQQQKRLAAQKTQLSPVHPQVEKRLEKLEKLTVGSSVLQNALARRAELSPEPLQGMQAADQRNAPIPFFPKPTSISGSEAEFLSRQRSIEDASQVSQLTGHELVETAPVMGGNSNGFAGYYDGGSADPLQTLTEALRERVHSLEKQLQAQTKVLQKKETELEKKDNKVKLLSQELQQLRHDAANDIRRLQSEHEVEIVRIREQHSKDKAALVVAQDGLAGAPSSPSRSAATHAQLEGNKKLMDQLDALRMELRKNQQNFADERRATQIDFGHQLQALERKHKAELLELKSAVASLEDQLTQAMEDNSTARAETLSMRRLYEQADAMRLKAVEDQNRLRADLKNMQQSVQASYRLDTASTTSALSAATKGLSSTNLPAELESAVKLSEARSEAKLKQMANKVDFLKNQLDTEKKALEDLKLAYQQAQQELGSIREDYERKMRNEAVLHSQQLAEVEEKVALNYERRMQELTLLQKQMVSLSAAAQQGDHERLALKQRIEGMEQSSDRLQAQALAYKAEADQLRAQLQAMQQEREQEQRKDAGKLSQDAVLRRLDNERHYLKNQLSTEITLKNELQTALNKLQQQLSDVQAQWHEDVAAMKEALNNKTQEHNEHQQRWNEMEIKLLGEQSRLKALNADLKDGFVKMRDQLRMEQLTIENLQSEKARLKEDLQRTTNDLQEARELENQSMAHHRQQIDDMREVMADQEKHYQREVQRLKDELSRQFLNNSQTQADLLKTKRIFESDKQQVLLQIPAMRILEALKRWRYTRLQRSFRLWLMTHTLQNVAKQFRTQVEKLVRSTKEEQEASKLKALEALRAQLDEQREQDLRDCWERAMREAEDREREASDQARQQREDLEQQHRQLLQQAEEDFAYDLEGARREGQDTVQLLQSQFQAEKQALEARHAQALELLRHELGLQHEAARKDLEAELQAAHAQHVAVVKAEHGQALARQLSDFELQLDSALHKQKQAFDVATAKLQDRFLAEREQALQALRQAHAKETEEQILAHQEALQALRSSMEAEHARSLAQHRSDWHQEAEARLRQLRIQWEEEQRVGVATALQGAEEEFARRSAERDRLRDEEKTKALKLEAAKWKQIVKDTENSLQLEMNKVKIEVAEALEKEFDLTKERLRMSYDLQRAQDAERHKEDLDEVKRQHTLLLEDLRAQDQVQLASQQSAFEASLRQQLQKEMQALHAEELQQQEATFQQELEKERARLARLKEDFTAANAHYAEERSHFTSQVQAFDHKLEHMENLKKVEIQQLLVSLEKERDLWALQQEERDKALTQSLATEKERAITQALLEERKKHDLAMAFEKDVLQRDCNALVEQVRSTMQAQLEEVEERLRSADAVVASLRKELADKAASLEDTEDNLYDTTQRLKTLQKTHSVAVWQCMTRMQLAKLRFAAAMKDLEKSHEEKCLAQLADLRLKQSHIVLLTYKLARYLHMIFSKHGDIHTILTAYKVDEIRSVKKSIAALEKDIELVLLEREAAEEQRDQMVKDIAVLTAEVRNNEDELRALNSSASGGGAGGVNMLSSNGTININLARKNKRINQEIERLYEQIEAKKQAIYDTDNAINAKVKDKEEKEAVLIEHERKLMEIVLEQQKYIVKQLKEMEPHNEGYKRDMQDMRLPWTLSKGKEVEATVATAEEVLELLRKMWDEEDRATA